MVFVDFVYFEMPGAYFNGSGVFGGNDGRAETALFDKKNAEAVIYVKVLYLVSVASDYDAAVCEHAVHVQ